jgi:hypothetical protein
MMSGGLLLWRTDMSHLSPICSACGYEFGAEPEAVACPVCGGQARTLRKNVGDEVNIGAQDSVGIMMSAHFAQSWFEDALREAKTPDDAHARRREIVFAVCFAETYLFEWVRDEVVRGDVQKLNRYFEPGKFRRIEAKWKEIPKKLAADSLIATTPNQGHPNWENFLDVVAFRHGLVHAAASRPHSGDLPEQERAVPTMEDLSGLTPGWALGVVVSLIRRLHDAIQTTPPAWLRDP